MREQLDLRLSREISNLQNQLEHEHDRRLEEHKETIKQSIEVQLQDEHRRRLALQKERLALEYNQRLQRKIRELEADIEKEMEAASSIWKTRKLKPWKKVITLVSPSEKSNFDVVSVHALSSNFATDSNTVRLSSCRIRSS